MKKICLFLILLSFYSLLPGQTRVGSWSDHLSYSSVNCIALGAEEIYASTGSSLLIYNKKFSELKKMSGINGLTETGISSIGWSEDYKVLMIAYTNLNVDLLKNNIVYNIPDITRKNISGENQITKIRIDGKYAYLTTGFGIIIIDLVKKEIFDTWKPGSDASNNKTNDVAFGNGRIFAATDNGVFSADMSVTGLSYFGNWNMLTSLPAGRYNSLVFSGKKLYANLTGPNLTGDQIYSVDNSAMLFSFIPGTHNKSLDNGDEGFTVSSDNSVTFYSTGNAKKITSYGWGIPEPEQAIVDNNEIWIADIKSGLIKGDGLSSFTAFTVPGPASNSAFSISCSNGKTIICGGGTDRSWNNKGRALEISVFRDNEWSSILDGSILDPLRTLIDPYDNDHFFVSTWGGGLLEYRNNSLIKIYNESNSPLQSMSPGHPYVRICGMAMDNSKNLWITQTGVSESIKVLKPDGTWIVNPLMIDAPVIGDIIITSKGQKWIILPEGSGLFILDDNQTPDVFNDDKYKKIAIFDNENQLIHNVYSIAEDHEGSIWVGTDQGPVIYYNPETIFNGSPKAARIKIPRNDGTNLADYLLKTETITAIAVDGGNRKWLGTSGSGAYLLSPDGIKKINSFNKKNSPILSDSIVSMAIDEKSGDVWFGTVKGLLSYRSDATSGEENFSKVLIFPNPARENFTGNVSITGLVKDSEIRITDISGNLVYETVSKGGEASWDLTTYNGKRVSTGVYLIFCASKDGSQSFVTKMLVIH